MALSFAVALAIHLTPQGSPVGAVLLNMAVFGAVLDRWRSGVETY